VSSRPAPGPTQPPIQWVPGTPLAGVKRAGREADHPPPTSAEVNKTWVYTSTPPYVFVACAKLVKHRDNFTVIVFHCNTKYILCYSIFKDSCRVLSSLNLNCNKSSSCLYAHKNGVTFTSMKLRISSPYALMKMQYQCTWVFWSS
jgi:hypothetical protein